MLLQSTESTCIVAVGATYIKTLGFEATEEEMVRRGLISVHGGSDINEWRLLRFSLPMEYRIRAEPLTKQKLLKDKNWYLVCLK